MRISDVAIKKPVFAWMLMASLLIFGGLSFQRMGVSRLPDVDSPIVSISTSLEGAAPEVMEVDVVDPLEDAIMTIQGIQSISSSSRTGSASISVEFSLEKDVDIAVQEVENAIARAMRRLPKEMDPPTIRKSNPEDSPILWLSVSSDRLSRQELMVLVRDRIKDRFATISGVGEIFIGGYADPALRVNVSSVGLRKYQLTINDLVTSIQAEHSEVPSGRIENPNREMNIRTLGEAPSLEEFKRLSIGKRAGSPNFNPIPIGRVAEIEDGIGDLRRKSRVMGQPAVSLGVRKQRGANSVAVAHEVKKRLAEVQATLPEGVKMGINFDSTEFIEESIAELIFTLILSAILTALVCWIFLGSWSATLNVILAIPTSVVGTFIVLYAMGFTLNLFTLLGLSLAIGIVVDDAIMVLENITRHAEEGKDKVKAAKYGAREIAFAAMAATAAIIAIFLPVAFMQGVIGKFFMQFGVTISVAVALSLLEALTLTPMRCSQFLLIEERRTALGRGVEGGFEWLAELYRRVIPLLLSHRIKVILLAVGFFAGSCAFVALLGKEFTPTEDQSRIMLRAQAPIGSSLAFTETKVAEIEEILSRYPEVERYFASVGGFGGGEVNSAMLFVTLVPKDQRKMSQQELANKLRGDFKKIKDLRVVVRDLSSGMIGGRRGFPIEFSVRGPEWSKLVDLSEKIRASMTGSGLMTDVDSDYSEGMPEIQVVPDRTAARNYGVAVSDIGQTISAMMGGVTAGKYSKGGHRYDVRVQLTGSERTSPKDLKRIQIRNNRGELIPLENLVTIRERASLQSISRQDRQRAITLTANVAQGASQADALSVVEKFGKEMLPDGYYLVATGSTKSFRDSFDGLFFALILGLVVSYMVLASQFNSFIHPITVLVALPFSVSGAFIALYLGGQSLNIFSMIGIILLMGIVKKNSILLVDFTNQIREKGVGVSEALIQACPLRLRPILMTSFATVAGAIPPALAIGPGAESRIPMALAVIGGVVVSTILTLFVVPCVYSLMERWRSAPRELPLANRR